MEHNPLFDRLWGTDGSHPYGNPYEMERKMREELENKLDYEELETEICEFLKGDFRTTVICKFNNKGYMVSHTAHCEDISESKAIMNALREDLFKALEEERYEEAKRIQEHINKLRDITELRGKPTL
jgi:hypothetical protein